MSIQSMTGFGRYESEGSTGKYVVDIRSVNNRYFSLQCRMPNLFNPLEQQIKKIIQDKLERGSVNLALSWTAPETESTVVYNENLAGKYASVLKQMSSALSLSGEPSISDLSPFFRELISQELTEFTTEQLQADLLVAVEGACSALCIEREREGNHTASELNRVLDNLYLSLENVKTVAPERLERFKARMYKQVEDLRGEGVDEARLTFEIAIMAEKLDIAEEITRLEAHLDAVRELLSTSGAVGKRLGFLLQEMNREVNTIGSKANDSTLCATVVGMKESVEKLREQSENLV